jgi:hypothetical protein
MAYSVTGNATPIRRGSSGGKVFLEFEVVETDVDVANEFAISGLPAIWTLTRYEFWLKTAGAAANVRPALGRSVGFTVDTDSELGEVQAAAIYDVVTEDLRGSGTSLQARSRPNVATGPTGEIRHRLTFVEGH